MASDEKPDLNELLEHYGVRTKSRNSYMTNCPLHEDRTPSLSVRIDEALWNCHSCGESGDSYTLIMKKEGIEHFPGALAFAASLGLSAGGTGGGDTELSGSAYVGTRRARVPGGKRDQRKSSGYVPAWRRER